MKKLLSALCIVAALFIIPIASHAADAPVYDETFNNGAGAFFANGTPITISEDAETQDTIVSWDGGSLVVPDTTTIFGGGVQGTNYESSNITMESGTIAFIYGGGFSTTEDELANVTTSNIIVNNGTVLGNVAGGGLLYSQVETSNVTINNGTVGSVIGGGLASATIDGVNYNSGTQENPEDSFTRVENANVTINDGTINSESLGYGLVYGGGQGYSYTGNVNLTINGGDMSTAYVTAGGSNGYTGTANVEINGGDINIYQSVNRGQLDSASLRVTGGNIENLYVGGETGDSSVNGTVNTSNVSVTGGTVENLDRGTSGGQELEVDGENYSTVFATGTVTNNNIGEQEVEISYTISINPSEVRIFEGQSEQLEVVVTTEPAGYENLFTSDQITWSSSDENIATVNQNGVVTGVNNGTAVITATLNNQSATANVTVSSFTGLIIFLAILLLLFILFLAFALAC